MILTRFRLPIGPEGGRISPAVGRAIQRVRGRGAQLDAGLQEQMAKVLGYDLSGVRIHTGPEADDLSRQFMATAFTVGADIFFSQGSYDPGSRRGRTLIAHELIHVVQQNGGRVGKHEDEWMVHPCVDILEQEAAALAGIVMELATNPVYISSAQWQNSGRRSVKKLTGSAETQIQRLLADRPLTPVPPVPNVGLACHSVTWYWAAQEAQSRNAKFHKEALDTLMNIGSMPGGAQAAMLALPRSGSWDFSITPTTPPAGTVLLWTESPTHSAVVTGPGLITGYNQSCVFPTKGSSISTGRLPELRADRQRCFTISDTTIVAAAANFNL